MWERPTQCVVRTIPSRRCWHFSRSFHLIQALSAANPGFRVCLPAMSEKPYQDPIRQFPIFPGHPRRRSRRRLRVLHTPSRHRPCRCTRRPGSGGQAQTGTGKPRPSCWQSSISSTRSRRSCPGAPTSRVLILAPTRELAVQIYNDACVLAGHTGLKVRVVYGGTGYDTSARRSRTASTS